MSLLRRIQGVALGGVLFLAASQALAVETTSINAQAFMPPVDPYGYITLNGARSLKGFAHMHAALYFNWAHDPFEIEDLGAGVPDIKVIENVSMVDLNVGLGILAFGNGGLEVGFDLPMAVNIDDGRFTALDDTAFGDLRTDVKLTLLDREEDVLGVAFRGSVTWPTGDDGNFLSNGDNVNWIVTAIVEKKAGIVRLGVEVGFEKFRYSFNPGIFQIDDKVHLGAGLGIELVKDLELVAEIQHTTRWENPWDHEVESPIEFGGAIRYSATPFFLAGASGGLNDGVGAPDSRFFFALGVTF